ncbi:MAG: hypothetical protein ACC700_15235, partial [Anaerolineales bacterium]
LLGPTFFSSPPDILFSTSEVSSTSTQIAQPQAVERAVTPTPAKSEQELFIDYDAQLAEWFDQLATIDDDEPKDEIFLTAQGRNFLYRGLFVEMRGYEPPQNLGSQHAGFVRYVDLLRIANMALIGDPPDEANRDRLYLKALDHLDSVIADYADYGTSLGFDIWPGICADIPDHYRC